VVREDAYSQCVLRNTEVVSEGKAQQFSLGGRESGLDRILKICEKNNFHISGLV
jgi:hypothetical protein